MRKLLLSSAFLLSGISSLFAYDWDGISVPANAGTGNYWQLQTNVSDDFNYTMSGSNRPTEFTNKWVAAYHNNWAGPGLTLWNAQQAWSNGSQLAIQAQAGTNNYVYCGIITSINYIQYPIYT